MAITYSTTAKDNRMNALLNTIDGNGTATLEIGTSAMAAVLVSITLGRPSFSEASGVLTFLGPKSGTATGTGTAAAARIKDGAGNIVVSGLTVSATSGDIVVSSTTITANDTVTINNSGTITHA